MREILFKAKSIHNGEWVEGYLYIRKDGVHEINYYNKEWDVERYTHEVDANTICRYTGLTDYEGNKIWENDILEWEFTNAPSNYYHCLWLEDEIGYTFKHNNDYTNALDCYDEDGYFCMKVIGNVIDNPELLSN